MAAAVGCGPGEALRFPRLRPDQDICEGRGWGEGRAILKVRPRVSEKGLRNSPLDAYIEPLMKLERGNAELFCAPRLNI